MGHRLKRDAANQIAVALHLARPPIPKATGRRRVHVFVTLAGRVGMMDPDNVLKVLADALVANGLIVDDSSRWIEIGVVRVYRGKEKLTLIVLEDL